MRTVISGKVTLDDLADAELLGGITPTLLISNGKCPLPKSKLPVEHHEICDMHPRGEDATNFRLVRHADALISRGENAHLVRLAKEYDLLVLEL